MKWLSIIIIIAIIAVLADGFLRKFRSRSNLRVKLDKNVPDEAVPDPDEELTNSELPVGRARTIRRKGKPPEFSLNKPVDVLLGSKRDRNDRETVDEEGNAGERRDPVFSEESVLDQDPGFIEEEPDTDDLPDDIDDEPEPVSEESDEAYEPFDESDWDEDGVGEVSMVAEKDDAPDKHRKEKSRDSSQTLQSELPLDREEFGKDDFDETEDEAGDDAQPEVEEVIVINVMAPPDGMMAGKEMLAVLLKQGMRLGNMSIFHRHADSSGNGPVMFSMANMVQPGTFDMGQMEEFSTPGVSLFLQLPGKHESYMQSFERMLETANALKDGLGGELKDENRSVLTRQTIEHYRQRIRDFELRQLSRK